ncbi:DMP12 family DNA mimic protein [Psychrobacter celer]|uniref:DMP12 family DNA mimic protein n=1 Tax=Psychrobacter celer TaxID=306572 RepID=UPI003FD001B1
MLDYSFFFLPAEVDIDDYDKKLQWGFNYPEALTVLSLNQEQVDFYHELGLWNIMSDYTDYMIGPSDSNVIFDEEIEKIRDMIVNDFTPKDKNIEKMIDILNYAMTYNKAVIINLG